jgi:hypothetical protein
MRGIDFKDGLYKTPKIGPAKRFDDYPQSSIEVLDGLKQIGDISIKYRSPRAIELR